jgi:multidrug transporter EmrE-like cation transporter
MAGQSRRPGTLIRCLLLACGGLAIFLLIWFIAQRFVLSLHYADSDFFTFWLGGRFVVSGLDPYDPALWTPAHGQYGAVWISDSAFTYPLPLAILMAPLGAVDLLTAYQIWIILSGLMILAASWLVFGRPTQQADVPFVIPWLAGILLFRPVIVTLRNGQLGGFLLFVLALGCSLAADKKDRRAGAVLGLLSLKPALGLPILGLLAVWMLTRRRWGFVAGMLACLTPLFLLGWLYDPQWVGHLAQSGSPKLFFNVGYFPTAWGLGTALCAGRGACGWWAGSALAASGVMVFGWALIRHRSLPIWEAASLAVPAALFASPYVGAYDLLLLVVPIGIGLRRLRSLSAPYLAVAGLPFVIDLVSLLLVLVAARLGLDLWSALLDPLAMALVLITMKGPLPEAPNTPDLRVSGPPRRA